MKSKTYKIEANKKQRRRKESFETTMEEGKGGRFGVTFTSVCVNEKRVELRNRTYVRVYLYQQRQLRGTGGSLK